ncbi:MAG: 4-hydroxy-3-methylbut-2-enyl diphosphate reductase, partial [Leptolyngbyaceae cyanobacterium bins.59]|nr:4-hydroxy-3-methylbut-2-enyl diphosphate reductase [Leptolyngbyaceae cyanobacterium bins.59]
MDTKAFKRSLHSSENYHRKGFGHEAEVSGMLQTEYQSNLVQQIRDNNFTLQQGEVTIRLAEAFGFCWGVERAVAMAYETRQHFPTERIWITNEIIHNPSVNKNLRDMQVEFVPLVAGQKDFSV